MASPMAEAGKLQREYGTKRARRKFSKSNGDTSKGLGSQKMVPLAKYGTILGSESSMIVTD